MSKTLWNFHYKLKSPDKKDFDYAFLVLNQPILCDSEMIKSLWNKANFRALADGGSNQWIDFIEKGGVDCFKLPDLISGDFDSIKPKAENFFKKKAVTFISTPDQDETDFTKALQCIFETVKAQKLQIKCVFVLCENSGRFDQIIGNVNTLIRSNNFIKDIPSLILSSQCVTWVLPPGKHTICVPDEFIERQYSCGLIPLCGPTVVTTSGFKWNLDNQMSVMGGLVSTSNTFVDKEVNITCDRDLIWTTQYCEID